MRPSHISIILDHELAGAANGEHTPVMLWGPPGIGKSDLVRQAGERHRVPVVDIRLSQMEPSDLRGIPFRKGVTGHFGASFPSVLSLDTLDRFCPWWTPRALDRLAV